MELLAQVVLNNRNGIARDAFVNTFALEKPGASATAQELQDVAFEVSSLYTSQHPATTTQTNPLYTYVGSQVSRTMDDCHVNLYDITGKLQLGAPDAKGRRKPPAHGSPIATRPFTMLAPAYANAAPNQMAVVCTLRSRTALESPVEDGVVRPRARGTGRFYFGPLAENCIVNSATNPTVSDGLRADLTEAIEGLQEDLNARGWALSVWSRTRGMLSVVTSCEVDNALDVIRSRRLRPTVRTKNVFAPVPALALGA